jgi:hypothetical protein
LVYTIRRCFDYIACLVYAIDRHSPIDSMLYTKNKLIQNRLYAKNKLMTANHVTVFSPITVSRVVGIVH